MIVTNFCIYFYIGGHDVESHRPTHGSTVSPLLGAHVKEGSNLEHTQQEMSEPVLLRRFKPGSERVWILNLVCVRSG